MTETTAGVEGPEWSAKAALWAELWAHLADPARALIIEATAVGAGTRLLDIGCGSGELCAQAAARGATVSGIDAAEGMIEIARARLPDADLRVGPMESLPWDDDGFDVVSGVNAFQFAADIVGALAEARRVARPGGRVAICNWSERREVCTVLDALEVLLPPQMSSPPTPDRPRVRNAAVLERLVREAGLEPENGGEVDVPYEVPDEATLERALLIDVEMLGAIDAVGEEEARRVVLEATARYRRPDGSYRFENRFRYLIARA
jgi:SAM-dependent methyltransferase